MFVQVTGVVPVSLVSDLSRIFLFKLTFKKAGGESHSNKWCFNSDKAVPINKARKAALEPALVALPFPPEPVQTVLACVSRLAWLCVNRHLRARGCPGCPSRAGLGWAQGASAVPGSN